MNEREKVEGVNSKKEQANQKRNRLNLNSARGCARGNKEKKKIQACIKNR